MYGFFCQSKACLLRLLLSSCRKLQNKPHLVSSQAPRKHETYEFPPGAFDASHLHLHFHFGFVPLTALHSPPPLPTTTSPSPYSPLLHFTSSPHHSLQVTSTSHSSNKPLNLNLPSSFPYKAERISSGVRAHSVSHSRLLTGWDLRSRVVPKDCEVGSL